MDFNVHDTPGSFDRIASELMNHHAIKVKNDYYRVVDCEFYYKCETHNDPYTHGHDEQEKNGSWYFHGSGIDITIGNRDQKAKGGILLRSIAKLSADRNPNGNFIEVNKKQSGPLNVLTTLFSHFHDVFDNENSFYLVKKEDIVGFIFEETEIFKCDRVGLNENKDSHFHNKPYRYIAFPYLPHTEKAKIQEFIKKDISEIEFEKRIKPLFVPKYFKTNQPG